MNWLWRLFLFFIGHRAKLRAIGEVKRRGVIAYMQTLQAVRLGLMGALAVFFVLQLMLLSLVGATVTGVWLLDLETQTKLQILVTVFGLLFSIPAIALSILLSQRLWYKASGAEKMVEKIRQSESA